MEKSITSPEYATFLHKLWAARKKAGVTQTDLAARLGETQSFVSKCERGERRLDVIELRAFCQAFGLSVTRFIEDLDATLKSSSIRRR